MRMFWWIPNYKFADSIQLTNYLAARSQGEDQDPFGQGQSAPHFLHLCPVETSPRSRAVSAVDQWVESTWGVSSLPNKPLPWALLSIAALGLKLECLLNPQIHSSSLLRWETRKLLNFPIITQSTQVKPTTWNNLTKEQFIVGTVSALDIISMIYLSCRFDKFCPLKKPKGKHFVNKQVTHMRGECWE